MFAYLITSKDFYGDLSTNNLESFKVKMQFAKQKIQIFNNKYKKNISLKYACLRYENAARKKISNNEISFIESFCEICENLNISPVYNVRFNILEIMELLIQKNINIGIHLKDSNIEMLNAEILANKLKFYSAHSIDSIITAINYNADFVTLSPIYYDKYNKALGLSYLQNLDSKIKEKTIALGGINTDSKILEIESTNIIAFASISYFL